MFIPTPPQAKAVEPDQIRQQVLEEAERHQDWRQAEEQGVTAQEFVLERRRTELAKPKVEIIGRWLGDRIRLWKLNGQIYLSLFRPESLV